MTSAKTWWFLPTLPQDYERFLTSNLEQILSLARTYQSSEFKDTHSKYDLELVPLFNSAELKLKSLNERSSDEYLWTAQLTFKAWSESELSELERLDEIDTHSPLKYWVELSITHVSKPSYSCQISPAEHKAITLMDRDLGRRIGDELDGKHPV